VPKRRLVAAFKFSAGVWQLWSRHGLPSYDPSAYQVPPLYIAAALILIAVIVAGALLIRPRAQAARKADRRAPRPWLLWLLSFGFSLVWFFRIILAYLPATSLNGLPLLIPIGVGLAWIGVGLLVVRRISSAADWGDRQRLALIFGASAASMLGGTLVVLADAPIDILSKFVFDLIAIVLFIRFAAHQPRAGSGRPGFPHRAGGQPHGGGADRIDRVVAGKGHAAVGRGDGPHLRAAGRPGHLVRVAYREQTVLALACFGFAWIKAKTSGPWRRRPPASSRTRIGSGTRRFSPLRRRPRRISPRRPRSARGSCS
jgi:hypothetical protein